MDNVQVLSTQQQYKNLLYNNICTYMSQVFLNLENDPFLPDPLLQAHRRLLSHSHARTHTRNTQRKKKSFKPEYFSASHIVPSKLQPHI